MGERAQTKQKKNGIKGNKKQPDAGGQEKREREGGNGPEQKFLTIKEVSGRTGLSISTLRYYDSEGLTPQVVRTSSGIRQYTEEDVCWLELICCLKHSTMALEDIRRFMEPCLEGEEAAEKRKAVLLKQKDLLEKQIVRLECSLELIECKLEHYKEIGSFHFGKRI